MTHSLIQGLIVSQIPNTPRLSSVYVCSAHNFDLAADHISYAAMRHDPYDADHDDLVGYVGHAKKVFPRESLPKAIFRFASSFLQW